MTTSLVHFPQTTSDIFDRTRDALLGNDIYSGMNELRTCLRSLRARLDADAWSTFGAEARRHPLHGLLLESPFTRRAFLKPRGYAGDAVLMDLIYGTAPAARELSPLGGMLYGYEFDSPCFQSVRTRRAYLAREIDDVARERPGARVLSVACGHLREVEWSRAVREGEVSITALDQDRESLDLIDREYGRYGVCTLPGTVGDVLRRSLRFRELDLVYASGLLDYLENDLARALISGLFRMLGSGGRLLIANFTPDTRDAAFMEAVMDWRLVHRDEEGMRSLVSAIQESEIADLEQFRDDNGNITYLRLVRR
jgi:extracellular factor (EF) 3-hydroxypalmitic acid methyl ester biosynthesis protein